MKREGHPLHTCAIYGIGPVLQQTHISPTQQNIP